MSQNSNNKYLITIVLGLFCIILSINKCDCQYSEKQLNALKQLRHKIPSKDLNLDYMKTDSYLMTWLIKHKYDVDRTAAKIKSSLKWRKENRVDSILDEDFTTFIKTYPFDLNGVDREGRPVWIFQIGRWDLRKLNKVRELNDKNEFKNITQYTLVTDMAGFNLRQHGCIRCFQLQIQFELLAEDAYPQTPFKYIMVNTPATFAGLFNTLKQFVPASYINSFEIYDFDQTKWAKALEKYISPDQLPPQYRVKQDKQPAKNE